MDIPGGYSCSFVPFLAPATDRCRRLSSARSSRVCADIAGPTESRRSVGTLAGTRRIGTQTATLVTLWSNWATELGRLNGVCSSTEGHDALQDLRGIFAFVKVDREEHIVRREAQGRDLACAKKVRDILHLHERHRRLLVFETRRNGQVDQSDITSL